MKTCKTLLRFAAALLLTAGLNGCQDYEIPEANPRLSYPAGEIAVGTTIYTSAIPSLRTASIPQFSITGITHNGQTADAALTTIDAATGVITVMPPANISAMGVYLVSVKVTDKGSDTNYSDVFRLVVKGIVYDAAKAVATRGTELVIPVKEAYFVQQEGTEFKLAAPEDNSDYDHFSVDPKTCSITVDAKAEAGIYPISIQVVNRTNPDGTMEIPGIVFDDVVTITVESKPYDLKYAPASITLIPMEGHTSPKPTLRTATAADGTAVTYSLLDTFDGAFSIDAATGAITLAEDTKLVEQTAKTFDLQVRATNSKGTASFPDIYAMTVDPEKKADPITSLNYPGTFPVKLLPGEAWTSERPAITGSTVGIQFSLKDAPTGVSIAPKTGIITMAAGHSMPLLTKDNKLNVAVVNVSMTIPFATTIGDFSINPIYWSVEFMANTKENATTNSGIANMDRYSFSTPIQNNQNATGATASTIQVKNAFGRSNNNSINGITCIDFISAGKNTWHTPTQNKNNDWVVSAEIGIPATSFNPVVEFNLMRQYGTDEQNFLELYIVEINTSNVYTKGAQNQDDKGLNAKPSELPWVALATTDKDNTAVPLMKWSVGGYPDATALLPNKIDISAYKGKKVRIAMRLWNPSDSDNNSRTYRIESLRVEDHLTK